MKKVIGVAQLPKNQQKVVKVLVWKIGVAQLPQEMHPCLECRLDDTIGKISTIFFKCVTLGRLFYQKLSFWLRKSDPCHSSSPIEYLIFVPDAIFWA